MFYVFLLVLAGLGALVYLTFFLQNVPGALEERLGVLEPLPPKLGEWEKDLQSAEAARAEAEGLQREVRYFLDESQGQLLKQARYRSLASDEIVRVEPDQSVKRRRVKR